MDTKTLRLDLKWLILGVSALAAACDDPIPPSAQGAASFRITNRPQMSCPYTVPNATIGAVNDTSSNQIVDGEGGKVSCSVSPNGAGFVFSASITQGDVHFEINADGPISATQSTTAQVGVSALANSYSSATSAPCSVELIPDSPIGGGKIWAKFSCSIVQLSGTGEEPSCAILGNSAKAPGGYFIFENCAELARVGG